MLVPNSYKKVVQKDVVIIGEYEDSKLGEGVADIVSDALNDFKHGFSLSVRPLKEKVSQKKSWYVEVSHKKL